MDVSSIASTILLSALVSGIVVFAFQQYVLARVNKLTAELEHLRQFNQGSYERLVDAYKRIWGGLVDIEDFVRHGIVKEVQSGVVSPENWEFMRETYKDFRTEMLFLPDALYDETNQLVTQLEQDINDWLDVLRNYLATRDQSGEMNAASEAAYLQRANEKLDRLRSEYVSGLDRLRHEYQRLSRDVVLRGLLPDSST